MHGILVGAILGMAALAFLGAARSLRAWRGSKPRPALWVALLPIGLQVALGLGGLVFGFWFLLIGE